MQKGVIPDAIIVQEGESPAHRIAVVMEVKSDSVVRTGRSDVDPEDVDLPGKSEKCTALK